MIKKLGWLSKGISADFTLKYSNIKKNYKTSKNKKVATVDSFNYLQN